MAVNERDVIATGMVAPNIVDRMAGEPTAVSNDDDWTVVEETPAPTANDEWTVVEESPAPNVALSSRIQRGLDSGLAMESQIGRDRTMGTVGSDLAVKAASGANAMVGNLAGLYGLTTGDMDNPVSEQAKSGQAYWEAKVSPELKAQEGERRAAIDAADGEWAKAGTAVWETLKNPALLSSSLAEQGAMLMPMVGAGRAAGATAKALGAGKVAADTAAVAGGVGAGAVLQGADTGGDAFERLMALPDPVWAQNAEYRTLIEHDIDPNDAKQRVALRLSRDSAAIAAIASGALNLLPGARVLEKSLAGVPVAGKLGGKVIAGAAGEMAQEGGEEAIGMAAQNRAVQGVDLNQSLAQGVGEAGGMGAVVGGPMGGVAGALSRGEVSGLPPPNRLSVDDIIGGQVGDGTPNAEGGASIPGPTLPASMPVPVTDANSPAVRGHAEDVTPEQVELAPAPAEAPLVDAAEELRGQMREPAPTANIDVVEREMPVTQVELAPPPVDAKPPPEPPASNIDIAERQVERIDAAPAPSGMQKPEQTHIENDEGAERAAAPPLADEPQTVTDRKKAKVAGRDARAASERYHKEAAIKPDTDDLLTAVAKAGGISREAAAAAGIDPAEFTRRGWKIKRVFTTSGMPLEAMSEHLAQLGYPVTDEHGYGENAMLAALDRSLRGEKLGTMQAQQDTLDAMADQRDAEFDMEDPFGADGLHLDDSEYDGLESHGQQAVFDAMERARDAGLTDDDIEALTERAAIKELSNDDFIREIEQEAEAKRGHSAGPAQVSGEQGEGARTEAPPALDSYTAEDLAALDKQKADAAAARAKQEAKAQADDERGSFTLTGSNSAVDQAEARGQSNLFDTAPPPTVEPTKDRETVTRERLAAMSERVLGAFEEGKKPPPEPPRERKEGELDELDGFKPGDRVTYSSTDGANTYTGTVESVADRSGNKRVHIKSDVTGQVRNESLKRIKHLVDTAAHEAATSPQNDLPAPTEAQIQAGNYKKGHVNVDGLDISIENPEGSKRRPEWPTLKSHYGYLKRTEGGDGEHIDVFVKPGATESPGVYIVDQIDPKTGNFDEHKVMLGFESARAAREAYLVNYTKDWKGLGAVTFKPMDDFKTWLQGENTSEPANIDLREKAASTKAQTKPATEQPQAADQSVKAPDISPDKTTNVTRLKAIPPAVARRVRVSVDQMIEGQGVMSTEATAHDALKDIKREIAVFKKLLACVSK